MEVTVIKHEEEIIKILSDTCERTAYASVSVHALEKGYASLEPFKRGTERYNAVGCAPGDGAVYIVYEIKQYRVSNR